MVASNHKRGQVASGENPAHQSTAQNEAGSTAHKRTANHIEQSEDKVLYGEFFSSSHDNDLLHLMYLL